MPNNSTCSIDGCEKPRRQREWCPAHYARWRKYGDPTITQRPDMIRGDVATRFWGKVDKNGPLPAYAPELGECWLWTGALDRGGYGNAFRIGRKMRKPHQVAWELYNRALIPEGLAIDHLCRVHNCVNPSHLEPVTCRENLMRGETIARRNGARTHCPQGHPYDEANTSMKNGSRVCRACHKAEQRRRYVHHPRE